MRNAPPRPSPGRLTKACAQVLLVAALAQASGSFGADEPVAIRPDSPQTYTVVEGDTLWDIAGMFLEEPWLWPEVWQINPQIENPDLIYPGDIIELAYVDGSPVLRLSGRGELAPASGTAGGLRTIRLSPQVRREALLSPIPAISLDQISSHLSENSVVSEELFDNSPYLLTEREGRNLASTGDEILARGPWTPGVVSYDIVREGREFIDPDTDEILGIEALFVGRATIARSTPEEAILTVDSAVLEIREGDRFIPREEATIDSSYLPTPPPFAVDAAIVSIGTGNQIGGVYDTLILNAGEADGLEPGHLLTVQEPGIEIEDEYRKASAWQKLKRVFGQDEEYVAEFPGDNIATVLVYRVFDDASLGLVLKSNNAVRLNDRVVTP